MQIASLLKARKTDEAVLKEFVTFFEPFTTKDWLPVDNWPQNGFERHLEILELVPLVFLLMPSGPFHPASPARVKPYVEAHLRLLGIDADEDLVNVVTVLTQRYRESYSSVVTSNKMSIGKLRATPNHAPLHALQGGRCALCGAVFGTGEKEETLDHIVPFRLGGDLAGGKNWQLLCKACNRAKSDWLTALQAREIFNWAYGTGANSAVGTFPTVLTPPLRYVALSLASNCKQPGCISTRASAEFHVTLKTSTGLYVLDNLHVACDLHK